MYIILVYDIKSDDGGQKVLSKTFKICKRYLSHIQNSVFEGELSNALSKLLMLSENYPNLKADIQFLNLQEQLQTIESEIEKSRRYYNGAVRILNTSIQKVPTCIIASLFKFSKEPFFEIENDNERENIKVKF